MESLQEAHVKRLRKMSTERVRGKLLANLELIGATADQIKEMPTATLLDAMASLYSILKEQTDDPLSSEAESSDAESEHGSATTPPNSDAAIQLEILKLQLKLQKEQAAVQLAQQQHEREKLQHEREMKDKNLEMRRMEAAANEKLKREDLM